MVEWIEMATKIYNRSSITLLDGKEIELIPLKIRYLRDFMVEFENMQSATNDIEAIDVLTRCAFICMKQYYPEISNSFESFEDAVDMPSIYTIIDIAAGIKINKQKEASVKEQADSSGSTWQDLDLAKLESEVFLLGIWKDYQQLEESLSIPELMITLSSKRELDYEERKFLAALQGVDLDGEQNEDRGQKEWEDLKARVFSKGATSDSNDILALQGQNAVKAGFGIGLGLDYDDDRDPSLML